ncbi:hypothetical protein NUU61_004202 [Penicillium alfredii]|uniref:Indoleamine 2,3-dioxygenase n=1 Tax=Penicillium alfredii TaxID=1506179 RepID=A0A9W9FKR8_9EURO|nr:uncharacterized protein NUU61_004202 [Penicillium alfredii]KAJ5101980.1 hypothetical protein NUU61_004202 [Penicillium alfredii]
MLTTAKRAIAALSTDILPTALCQPTDYISQIKASKDQHVTAEALRNMINLEGAGNWPPNASHRNSWPTVLRPYHDIFLELAPLLPSVNACADVTINQIRREEYRMRLQKLLQDRVDLAAIESLLLSSKANGNPPLSRDACNGFFACIGYLRHGFRWATVPIVKVAQEEKIIDFPPELNIPWDFLRRKYGVKSPGGNITSNFHCNFDANEQLVYQVNSGMPEPVPSAEYHFAQSFRKTEKQSLPVYYHLVQSIISFDNGQIRDCNEHLRALNEYLRSAIRVYYNQTVSSKIPHSIFVPYLQGFHGWAAGDVADGHYTEYDGLSGGHLILFNLLDLFLGLNTFLPEEDFVKYVPARQREFLQSVKNHAFRARAKEEGKVELEKQFNGIASQMRIFRSAHRKRTRQYLSNDRPERKPMTAGGSTMNTKDVVEFVDESLKTKMKDTV